MDQIWKFKNLKNPFIFWLSAGTCCKNLAILNFKRKNLVNNDQFFFPTKNPLYLLCFLGQKPMGKISPKIIP